MGDQTSTAILRIKVTYKNVFLFELFSTISMRNELPVVSYS